MMWRSRALGFVLLAAGAASLLAALAASRREDPSIARRDMEAAEARALAPLRAIEKFGYEIGKPAHLDFLFSTPDESAARGIADKLGHEAESTQVWFEASADSNPGHHGDDRWHVKAYLPLVLSVEGVEAIRQRFEAWGAAKGARYDGWGLPFVAH